MIGRCMGSGSVGSIKRQVVPALTGLQGLGPGVFTVQGV